MMDICPAGCGHSLSSSSSRSTSFYLYSQFSHTQNFYNPYDPNYILRYTHHLNNNNCHDLIHLPHSPQPLNSTKSSDPTYIPNFPHDPNLHCVPNVNNLPYIVPILITLSILSIIHIILTESFFPTTPIPIIISV